MPPDETTPLEYVPVAMAGRGVIPIQAADGAAPVAPVVYILSVSLCEELHSLMEPVDGPWDASVPIDPSDPVVSVGAEVTVTVRVDVEVGCSEDTDTDSLISHINLTVPESGTVMDLDRVSRRTSFASRRSIRRGENKTKAYEAHR